VENVTVENVTGTAGGFGQIAGPPKATVRNIALKNIDLQFDKPGVNVQKVQGLKVENVKFNGESYSPSR
jgi:hypothetical protein